MNAMIAHIIQNLCGVCDTCVCVCKQLHHRLLLLLMLLLLLLLLQTVNTSTVGRWYVPKALTHAHAHPCMDALAWARVVVLVNVRMFLSPPSSHLISFVLQRGVAVALRPFAACRCTFRSRT